MDLKPLPTQWVTPVELANYYRVKVPTVRLWKRDGAPHLKCGRLVRFNVDLVQQWLEQRTVK
jgi:excisionase family DNA binding protein